MLVRASALALGMSQYLVDQIAATPNIEVLTRTEVVSVRGTQKLEGLVYRNHDTGQSVEVDTPAMFIFIGAMPHTEFVRGVVEMNNAGFICTGPELFKEGKYPRNWKLQRDPLLLETNVPGIFAAGDARAGSTKRVANAVGEGAVCVHLVHQYLKEV